MNRPHRAIQVRPLAFRRTCRRQPLGVAWRGRRALGLCMLVAVVAACDDSPRQPLQQATRGIQRQRIDQHGEYLSSDALAGRHFASSEAESASAYLLQRFDSFGIASVAHSADLLGETPASFAHSFGITLYRLGLRNRIATQHQDKPRFLRLGADFLPLLHSQNARVVGRLLPLTQRGALQTAAADLRGKVVLVGHSALDPQPGESLETTLYRTTRQLEARGAVAVAFAGIKSWQHLRTTRYPSQLPPEQIDLLRSPRGQRTNMHLDRLVLNTQSVAWRLAPRTTIPVVVLGTGAWRSWQAGSEIGISVDLQQEVSLGQNILVGFGGKRFPQEVLLLVAHVDNAGVNAAGEILNGADDNASGVAALVEITRALTQVAGSLQRSVVVAFVTGELHGVQGIQQLLRDFGLLLGDRRVISAIVLDGIGRNGADRIVLHSTTASTDQQRAMERHNQRASLLAPALLLEKVATLPTPATPGDSAAELSPGRRTHLPQQHVTSHELLEWAGIASILINDGLDPFLYGQPEDDWKRIDTSKVARVARLVFRVTHELATLPASQTLPASTP